MQARPGDLCYNISGGRNTKGNFEGKIHLIRKNNTSLREIEKKLLFLRNQRTQPDKDNKILCGINALVAIAIIQVGRFLGKPELEAKAVGFLIMCNKEEVI